MSSDPGGFGGRLLNLCLAVLIGAMALYGAIAILQAIWLPLCIVVAVVAGIASLGWVVHRRIGRW